MSEPRKYELTDEVKTVSGPGGRKVTLRRIRALRDIPRHFVKAGQLGGWVEGTHNLSQYDDCWVADEACVYDNAAVNDNAYVYGHAVVRDSAYVGNQARVHGSAILEDTVHVEGQAEVAEYARLKDYCQIDGRAMISGMARIEGSVTVSDLAAVTSRAVLKGCVEVRNGAVVEEHAHISGFVTLSGRVRISGHTQIKIDGKLPLLLSGETRIDGFAVIRDVEDIITISPVGSEGGTLTAYAALLPFSQKARRTGRIQAGIGITRGCFHGSLEDFRRRLKYEQTVGSPSHQRAFYDVLIPVVVKRLKARVEQMQAQIDRYYKAHPAVEIKDAAHVLENDRCLLDVQKLLIGN